MENDIQLTMAVAFRDALLQHVVQHLSTDADWDAFNRIKRETEARENTEFDRFEREKPELLAQARKKLIDEAGSLTFQHPTPFGIDQFNRTNIDDEAERLVTMDHQNCLTDIYEDQAKAFDTLNQDIQARENVRDVLRPEFNRTVDRRWAGPKR